MKQFRLLTLFALLMTAVSGAWAQEQWDVVWDFTAWSAETVTALKADAVASKLEGWSDVEKKADAEAGADPTAATKDNCFWSCSGTVNADGNLSANDVVIKEFQGLKFNSDYAARRELAIAVNYPSTSLGTYHGPAYLYLGGSNQTCFTIPGVKAGSKITIEVESHKTSSARGIGLYKNSYAAENLIGEQFTPTTFEAKTWEIAEDCNVVVYNTNSCHIYTIKVKAPAGDTKYTVTMAEGTVDADEWTVKAGEGEYQSLPLEGVAAGTAVTVKYSGTKRVKSVKAVKKADNAYLKWDADQKKLVATEIPTTANKVQDSNENIEWAGTYVVEEDVTISGEIKLTGDVELIIKDGAKLTVTKIIHTQSGASLSVYGQTQMSGELNVTNQGSDAIFALNSFAVHSCKVTATSPARQGGGIYNATIVNVYGGSLDAECTGSYGHGIQLRSGGALNIYGGEVKAVGKGNYADYSYGIKSSNNSTGVATVTVYGGKLWTECAGNKALISVITLKKGGDFSGKIETSDNNTSWTEYNGDGTPETKYVRVGY